MASPSWEVPTPEATWATPAIAMPTGVVLCPQRLSFRGGLPVPAGHGTRYLARCLGPRRGGGRWLGRAVPEGRGPCGARGTSGPGQCLLPLLRAIHHPHAAHVPGHGLRGG